jgi:hypothetical protein
MYGLNMQAACPCNQHSGDRNNSKAFSWRKDMGIWSCFTHHCEEAFGNDVFGLVRSVLDNGFYKAVEWTAKVLKGCSNLCEPSDSDIVNKAKIVIHKPLDEDRLSFLKRDYDFINERLMSDGDHKRPFTRWVLSKYQVGTRHRFGEYMNNRIVIPVRDHEKFLVGFTGRTIFSSTQRVQHENKTGFKTAKWVHGRYFDQKPERGEFNVGSVLFNFYNAKNYINGDRVIILVEGPLDGFRLEEAGIRNWVAVLGSKLGTSQRELLLRHNVNKIVLALDPDRAGQDACDRIESQVGDVFDVVRVQFDTDPGDASLLEIRKRLDGYKKC